MARLLARLYSLWVALAVVLSTCSAANVHRPGPEDFSSKDATVESGGDDHEEAMVVNAEDDTVTAAASEYQPFFYAAQANANATDKEEEAVEESDEEELDGDSEDELNQMLDDVVGEIMMADELEGRSLHNAVWKNPYVPEYMQGMVGQLGGYSMALKSPYPDFSLRLGPPPPSQPPSAGPSSLYDHHYHGYRHSPFAAHHGHPARLCPPCPCIYDDHDEYDEEDEDYDEEHYEDDDVTVPYGFVFDPTVRYRSSGRSKRSAVDGDYWNTIVEKSKFLEKNNVGYAIKNDLRKRLEAESFYPLHYGHIYTGSLSGKDVHDRPFGHDADFDLYKDSHAFKLKPHGPRLGKNWIAHGYPIYAYSLYKLRKHVKGTKIVLVNHNIKQIPNMWLEPGVYRFVSILETPSKGSLMVENLKSGHRFIIPGLLKDSKKLSKFQAVFAYKDPNAKYVPVMTHGSMAYFVRATPLTGNDPKVKHDLLHHGFSDFKHSISHGSMVGIINKHNVKKGKKHLNLHPEPDPRFYRPFRSFA